MSRARGFTLLEVMVALAVIGATTAMTVSVGSALRGEQRQADASARDLAAVGKALRLAAEDVRSGRYAEASWTLSKDVLTRGDEVVARGVRAFDVRPEGAATRLSITVEPRSSDPGSHGPLTGAVVVRPRAKEAP